MNNASSLRIFCLLVLVCMAATRSGAQESSPESNPVMATGTLNLVLASKNGFVIAADSRMSSEKPFECAGKLQLYCDNSQKLFRTTPHSAMVIAGFAVGRFGTPLDLAVASVIRKEFATSRWPNDDHAAQAPFAARTSLEGALTDVATLFDPRTPPQKLALWATFARFDSDGAPIIEQEVFIAQWRPTGPRNVLVPTYAVQSGKLKISEFHPITAGISCLADAILDGHYRTIDPVILKYYKTRAKKELLDAMTIDDMVALSKAIFRETRKFTDLVGGADQIGVFPATGNVRWSLPSNLPTEASLLPMVMRWQGLTCTDGNNPPCGTVPVSFTISLDQPLEDVFKKFFVASEFVRIPVALDGNLFVGDTFDQVTFRWTGGPVVMQRNILKDCVLELPNGVIVPDNLELNGRCTIQRKDKENLDIYTIVGGRQQVPPGPCAEWDENHKCVRYSSLGIPRDLHP
jgi:hypothetical protein